MASGCSRGATDACTDGGTPSGHRPHRGAAGSANGPAAERSLLTHGHTSTSRRRQEGNDKKKHEQAFRCTFLLV
jgi:hypothetical protein